MKKYFINSRNFSHGVMFHHFHDFKNYKKSQGSISQNQFLKIIKFIGKKNIINADKFIYKVNKNNLRKNEVCITFDDGLKCHFDIIFPLLKKLNIKAFFFIYTSVLGNKPDLLEVFRYFRTFYYRKIDDFYTDFFLLFSKTKMNYLKIKKIEKKNIFKNKKVFPFYSDNDILFRILRDKYLNKKSYEKIMIDLMKKKNFAYKKVIKKLFLSSSQILELSKAGHIIGLHSHTHPTKIANLSYDKQKFEFIKNKKILTKKIKKNIISMSHPCGSYNHHTKKILKDLKIQIGFRSNLKRENKTSKINNSIYEIPREDHANIIASMRKNA